jgi:hypothetical protein
MALTDQERTRIREEEWVRLQTQEDFERSRQKTWSRPRIVALAFVGAALLLFGLVRTERRAPRLIEPAAEQSR